jgi:steroid delta-isomerase-like uncharacterized protein
MTGEELSRKRVQIVNEKRFSDLSEVLAPNGVTHYGSQDLHGVAELAGAFAGFAAAFSDMRTSIEALVVDGDRIGVRYMSRGTHSGEFMGVAPTGRTVAFGGAGINRILDGKIVETWTVDDLAALIRQISGATAPTFGEPSSLEIDPHDPVPTTTNAEEPTRLVRRWIELMNANAFDDLREVFAADLVVHRGEDLDDVRGFAAFKNLLESFYVGMPDLQVSVADIVAAGDTVIMRSVSRATHTGEQLGVPASGHELGYTGISTYRVVGGKLAVEWFNDDMFTLMQQLTAADSQNASAAVAA